MIRTVVSLTAPVAQINLTTDQINFFKDWIKDPAVVLFFFGILRRSFRKGLDWLRDEIMSESKNYIDARLTSLDDDLCIRRQQNGRCPQLSNSRPQLVSLTKN